MPLGVPPVRLEHLNPVLVLVLNAKVVSLVCSTRVVAPQLVIQKLRLRVCVRPAPLEHLKARTILHSVQAALILCVHASPVKSVLLANSDPLLIRADCSSLLPKWTVPIVLKVNFFSFLVPNPNPKPKLFFFFFLTFFCIFLYFLGYYSTGTLKWDEYPQLCNDCDVGQEREDCGLKSPGTCKAWPVPIITSVSGPGTKGGITNGGEQIIITGKNFVGKRGSDTGTTFATLAPSTADILVRYGSATATTTKYYLDNCVLALPCGLGDECSITCLTTEGVGADLNIEIVIYKNAGTASSFNSIKGASAIYSAGDRPSYAAPLISEYEGLGALRMASTVGGEDLIIKGANFGPPCPAPCKHINKAELHELLDDASTDKRRRRLATAKIYPMDPTKCAIFSHTRMKCLMPEGAGAAFKVVLTIGSLSSVETQMSYGPPKILTLEDVNGNTIDSIGTRGSDVVVLVGTNFPNDIDELDAVQFGTQAHGFQTYAIVKKTEILDTPGSCQVFVAASKVRCLTSPGVLRSHTWIITVAGQSSSSPPVTHYYAPVIDSVQVEDINERAAANELSLFPTRGGFAIMSGTNFGISTKGEVVPGAIIKVVLYPRGDLLNGIEKNVDVLAPAPGALDKDQLRFTMPINYGADWTVALRLSKNAGITTTYAPWPLNTLLTRFGYQSPTILHTETTNVADNKVLIEIIGTNFCKDQSCAALYVCEPGTTDPDKLCFAFGNKVNGPHAKAVAIDETAPNVISWEHTKIKITAPRSFDNRYMFVMVGGAVAQGGVLSNPAYHSSTNPEVHGICVNVNDDCSEYPAVLKAFGEYPTSGFSGVNGNVPIVLSILASEANLDTNLDPIWDSMRISVGSTTTRPVEQLITGATPNVDCKEADGTAIPAGCTRFTFRLPQQPLPGGWTGKNQPITLWVATIKSNVVFIDFEAPTITRIYKTGTEEVIDGIPTGGVAAGAGGALRKFDILGSNFGASTITNPLQLFFRSSTTPPVEVPLWLQPSSVATKCDAYTHNKFTGCVFPEGQGQNYVITLKVFGQPKQTFPVDATKLINYLPPVLTKATPDHGSTLGGYVLTIAGQNMGVEKPTITFGGVPVPAITTQDNGYHDSVSFEVPAGQGANMKIQVTVGGQISNELLFSYDVPTLTGLTPGNSDTDGTLNAANNDRIVGTLTGTNFGTKDNDDVQIVFKTVGIVPAVTFVATNVDIRNITDHTEMKFYIPPGYGKVIHVFVEVAKQLSSDFVPFTYNDPSVSDIAMGCGGFDDLSDSFVKGGPACYGYQPKGREHRRLYPSLNQVVVHSDRTATLTYTVAKEGDKEGDTTYPFTPSVGSSIIIQGMPVSSLLNRQYIVIQDKSKQPNTVKVALTVEMNKIAPDVYIGPPGAQIGATYMTSSITGTGFRFMETDACGAQVSPRNARNSGLEPFERWQDRNDQAGQSSSGLTLSRDCKQASVDRRQRIIITGHNFARAASAPITVLLAGKTCDCTTLLDGTQAPCRSTTNGLCSARNSATPPTCSAGTEDCATKPIDQTPIALVVEYHGENQLIVPVVPGFGRYHELSITVGAVKADPVVLRYHRPTVTGWMSEGSLRGESNVLKPDGASRLCYLGHNFGQGSSEVMQDLIEVRIGSE